MLVSAFHFPLPSDLIAQQPLPNRGSSRMLTLDRHSGAFADHQFSALPGLLQPGDLLILNDTRVLPSRLFATRAGLRTQASSPDPIGRVEVLLTEHLPNPEGHNDWRVLVRPSKKIQLGEVLLFSPPSADSAKALALRATILSTGCYGERTLRFDPVPDFHAVLDHLGYLPLPPYIHREKSIPNTPADRERYQTVFATERGSAAAPTAGLHFTPGILAQLGARGVEIAPLTLHVGLGTFQPVRVERTENIRLHAETYTLPASTTEALNRAFRERRRIVAVGTTSTRTLEHLARDFEAKHGPLDLATNPLQLEPHSGSTALFLSPAPDGDADFKLVGGLLTNFHLPQSTLLMLVSAFAGREPVLRAYAHAVAAHYRFFSYGDCMLIT